METQEVLPIPQDVLDNEKQALDMRAKMFPDRSSLVDQAAGDATPPAQPQNPPAEPPQVQKPGSAEPEPEPKPEDTTKLKEEIASLHAKLEQQAKDFRAKAGSLGGRMQKQNQELQARVLELTDQLGQLHQRYADLRLQGPQPESRTEPSPTKAKFVVDERLRQTVGDEAAESLAQSIQSYYERQRKEDAERIAALRELEEAKQQKAKIEAEIRQKQEQGSAEAWYAAVDSNRENAKRDAYTINCDPRFKVFVNQFCPGTNTPRSSQVQLYSNSGDYGSIAKMFDEFERSIGEQAGTGPTRLSDLEMPNTVAAALPPESKNGKRIWTNAEFAKMCKQLEHVADIPALRDNPAKYKALIEEVKNAAREGRVRG